MEERQVRELLDRLIATMDPAEEYEARHDESGRSGCRR